MDYPEGMQVADSLAYLLDDVAGGLFGELDLLLQHTIELPA